MPVHRLWWPMLHLRCFRAHERHRASSRSDFKWYRTTVWPTTIFNIKYWLDNAYTHTLPALPNNYANVYYPDTRRPCLCWSVILHETKYLIPNTWYQFSTNQVHGTRYLVPCIWFRTPCLVPNTWYQVLGAECMAPNTWYQACWYQVHSLLLVSIYIYTYIYIFLFVWSFVCLFLPCAQTSARSSLVILQRAAPSFAIIQRDWRSLTMPQPRLSPVCHVCLVEIRSAEQWLEHEHYQPGMANFLPWKCNCCSELFDSPIEHGAYTKINNHIHGRRHYRNWRKWLRWCGRMQRVSRRWIGPPMILPIARDWPIELFGGEKNSAMRLHAS